MFNTSSNESEDDESLPPSNSPIVKADTVKKKPFINVNASDGEGENADSFPSEARTPV